MELARLTSSWWIALTAMNRWANPIDLSSLTED